MKQIFSVLFLIMTLTIPLQNSFAQDGEPYIQVKHKYKNLRMQTYPETQKGTPDHIQYLILSAGAESQKLLGHELAHVVQQKEGKRIIQLILDGKDQEAENLTIDVVKYIGKTNTPFDVSAFLQYIHQQVVMRKMPSVLFAAWEAADAQRVFQRNESDLDFLRRTKSLCTGGQCDKETLAQLDKKMEDILYSQKELEFELESATKRLMSAVNNQSQSFNTLTNTSKARHDAMMATIQNTR